MSAEQRTKVAKLEIAAYAAPVVRAKRQRPIKVTKGEDWDNVVGTISHGDMVAKVLERASIELDSPRRCAGYDGHFCSSVATIKALRFMDWKIRSGYRKAGPWKCGRCARAEALAAMTADERSAKARKANATRRKVHIEGNPLYWCPACHRLHSKWGKTRHRAFASGKPTKCWRCCSEEERHAILSEASRRRESSTTPKQRAARSRKGAFVRWGKPMDSSA